MSVRLKAAAAAWFVLILAACDQSGALPTPPTLPAGAPKFLSVIISGTVLDLEGVPVSGVVVASAAITDSAGHFTLPATNAYQGATLGLTVRGDDCLTAIPTTTITSNFVNVDITVTRVYPLVMDGSTTAVLRPVDASYRQTFFTDEMIAPQARHYRYTVPNDSDVQVELEWDHGGNADLLFWTSIGRISQPQGDKRVFRLLRNEKGTLAVVQSPDAGPLSSPVSFTLVAHRIAG
jgi:hypothetical protein